VESNNYAASFGYQWKSFRHEQIDSFNGTNLSANRFFKETDWTEEWLSGKWVLDAGCGAGRFLDVVAKCPCDVVGVDISYAVDAVAETMRDRENVHLVQASIYDLPFRPGVFDGCYCIGVIQHTPNPEGAAKALPKVLKEGGLIAVTIYELGRWTRFNLKYIIRHVTKKMNKKLLLMTIKIMMPLLFSVTEILFRIPFLGRLFMFGIPVANYVHESQLSLKQRYRWAILDTFDMLSPEYDMPQRQHDVEKWLSETGISKIQRLQNPGLNLAGHKAKLCAQL
jgi:2-polyprenyl-3-methyl-5-hydroxy-6-metoxy-1,4-benzoquinol methylase